jgi:hypothetical protein
MKPKLVKLAKDVAALQIEIKKFAKSIIEQMNEDEKKIFDRYRWRESIENQVVNTELDTNSQIEWILDEIQWQLDKINLEG